MRISRPRALCSSGVPFAPGTRIISPNAVKITFGSRDIERPIVDSSHGQHVDGATGPVHQLDVGWKQVLQAEAVDRVGVATANFHQPVMPLRIGAPADLLGACGDEAPVFLRRSRGYAPGSVATLPIEGPILAVGADLKNTIALVVDGQAFMSQHIGDLIFWLSTISILNMLRRFTRSI
jgi:hypothetical protein